jgi:hypothetical protein
MKKIGIVSLVLGFMVLGLLPRTVSAQANVVKIDIPFAFMVQDTKLPPGTYVITKMGAWNYRISNLKGDQKAMVTTPKGDQKAMFSTESTTSPTQVKTFTLEFRVYGDQYYLSKFFHQGKTAGFMIPMTAAEKELAKKGPVTTKTITQ